MSATNLAILAGETDNRNTEGLNPVIWLTEHPQYDDWTLENDVVILRMERNLVFSDRIRAAILPVPNFFVAQDAPCVVSGWGDLEWGSRNFPYILQAVDKPAMTNARCQEIYNEEEILDTHLWWGSNV